ncbi:unnamed protein product [[Candida] boidinii]|uniref:Unnamed protein product n=1 Tax=Candida boidinii TaxID=5477 RepID=A0A9W6SZU2_CANBO|nr:unnamed protein product [[Candida] boidinii]GMG12049.1 unnamed protein product [[Candida] boidinii]GMG18426.1 unnamed protein product [[Candida] boidinii]
MSEKGYYQQQQQPYQQQPYQQQPYQQQNQYYQQQPYQQQYQQPQQYQQQQQPVYAQQQQPQQSGDGGSKCAGCAGGICGSFFNAIIFGAGATLGSMCMNSLCNAC